MSIRIIIVFISLVISFGAANASERSQQSCVDMLESDIAYIKQNIDKNGSGSPVSPEVGGPVDLYMDELFQSLDSAYVNRLKRQYTLQFVKSCNETPSMNVVEASSQVSAELGLDMSKANWGMKDIDTEKLLVSSCEDFVTQLQEIGVGQVFYNDPAQATFADYWAKFTSPAIDRNIIERVEGDAQVACSWEPYARLIDVLDEIVRGYNLTREK